MKIIISPAKKMKKDVDSLPYLGLPQFIQNAEVLQQTLKSMSYDQLKTLWKCNDQIAALNAERLEKGNLYEQLTPAILSYEGIQYQYMAPGVFTDQEFAYIQEHLRILSGFYGLLKPFDGVIPYRLEMQAKLKVGEARDLYNFWSNQLAESLFSETDCIINLASKEYSACVSNYLRDHTRFITCVFGEEHLGRIVEKGTKCKMARGEMVRYMAQMQISNPEDIQSFDRLNYHFSKNYSSKNKFVFIQKATKS